jgi:predicted ArsR family transcriptional regulator
MDGDDVLDLPALAGGDDDEARPATPRLEVLKALGDNTRYAIYLELARAPQPLATAEVAKSLGLHANTVRPHLERMRDLGLLELEIATRGGVGRPQHLYSLAADAPSLGLEPPVFPLLARMLLQLATDIGAGADDAADAGREQGRDEARPFLGEPCAPALMAELARLGFDPEAVANDAGTTIGFTHCPFGDLARVNPGVVCGLHRGMVEGFVENVGGGSVRDFRTLVDRQPCQVDLELSAGVSI